MIKATELKFSDIRMGDVYRFERKLIKDDVFQFAELVGDFNPIHTNEEFGKKSQFGKNIVHGMLVGGLFSTLVGMHCPGKNCLYISQTLSFKSPLFYDDTVVVKGTVKSTHDAVGLVVLKTEILRKETIIVTGEAKVRLLK